MTNDEVVTIHRCVTERRCGLCQFDLTDGDFVTTEIGGSLQHFELTTYRTLFYFDEDNISIAIHMCGNPQCEFLVYTTPCFHQECRIFTKLQVFDNFLSAMEFSFHPGISEMARRRNLLHIELTDILKKRFQPTVLSTEIWYKISAFLVKEYAVIKAEEISEKLSNKTSTILDLSSNVYIRFIVINRIRYVFHLSNSADPGSELLFNAERIPAIQRVDIGEDHLGVRQLLFNQGSGSSIPGLWWRHVSRSKDLRVRVVRDGLKVRRILAAEPNSDDSPSLDIIRLSTPRATLAGILDFRTNQRLPIDFESIRMSQFICNDRKTTGYSALSAWNSTITIKSHKQDVDSACYEEGDPESDIWVYMPIDDGEYVTAILARLWVRALSCMDIAIILTTNYGRTVMFAPYIRNACHKGFEYRQLHSPPNTLSPIYFANSYLSTSPTKIFAIAFEGSQPSFTYSGNIAAALQPVHGSLTGDINWYYSSCRLSDVVEITPCRAQRKDSGPIIGMLLRYRDNRRGCLGQYRLDWTTQPLQVSSKYLNIGLLAAGTGEQQVIELAVGTESIHDSYTWRQIPWSGTLEWWFLKNVCVLSHPEMVAIRTFTR